MEKTIAPRMPARRAGVGSQANVIGCCWMGLAPFLPVKVDVVIGQLGVW